jgi:hypothetical protein
MVNRIVEDGVFGNAIAALVSEIQAQGHRVRVIDYTRGVTNYEQCDSCGCGMWVGKVCNSIKRRGQYSRHDSPRTPLPYCFRQNCLTARTTVKSVPVLLN